MSFLKTLLTSGKTDEFGIDAAVDGIRQLRKRIESEKQTLAAAKDSLRDAALVDPSAQLDETAVVSANVRIEALEAALKKALEEASAKLNQKMPAIERGITDLEAQQEAIKRRRDEEYLKALSAFIEATGARVSSVPRQGVGGTIQFPALSVLTEDEARQRLEGLAVKPSKVSRELDVIVTQMKKLTTIRHFGGLTGLETLAG